MQQGCSGSAVRRKGALVEKLSSDRAFAESPERQRDLMALSRRLAILPRIERMVGPAITMQYVDGIEGLTEANAERAGQALRLLHGQSGYPHPCYTGIAWLLEEASARMARSAFVPGLVAEVEASYPADALIHSEPQQVIEQRDGRIVFIDIEQCGMGSSYQDLAQVYYSAAKDGRAQLYQRYLAGYAPQAGVVEPRRVTLLAGIVALAYAQFAEGEHRTVLGFRLLAEAGYG